MKTMIVAALVTIAIFIVAMVILLVIPPIFTLIAGVIVVGIGAGMKKELVGWIGAIFLGCTVTLMVLGDIAATVQGVFTLIFVVAVGALTFLAGFRASEDWFHRADAD